ncbi:hypothetical protein [Chryseobacterium gossypii]|uniref:hypothetical protein n=1 Tax=Chryseobacterium gossypii TaxID=3231602 RepID=UPI003525EF56
MKTKKLLTILGVMASQSLFFSCSEDALNTQPEHTAASKTTLKTTVLNFKSGNYFTNPQPINTAFNFIKAKISQQGASYVLTQSDLTEFYDKAQIDPTERLTLDQMNAVINETMNMMQTPFDQAIQQLNISDAAKSLAITIDTGSIHNLEFNALYINLSDLEKAMIKNLNDFKFNVEQGYYAISPIYTGKQPAWITGGMIGMAAGGVIGYVVGGPVGALIGAGAGVVAGIVVGAIVGAK